MFIGTFAALKTSSVGATCSKSDSIGEVQSTLRS